MSGNSRPVLSQQSGPHPALLTVVRRHLASAWRQPLADHNRGVFEQLSEWRQRAGIGRPLWLDSGCGTGRSAFQLALGNRDCLVIGVDQSAARLERGSVRFPQLPDNLMLVRGECADLWRLMVQAGWRLERHFLLYPNPWPKPGHLLRRWHGHPVFPVLLQLGGELELRSNWSVYPQEMALALEMTGKRPTVERWDPVTVLTDFEEKYRNSGHGLWRLTCCLN
ncbi:MAG: SAM-dependent methyltransferase [Alcanivoracaceae bacterium]